MKRNAEIRLDFQKLRLSFSRFRKKPLKSISSHIGESETPMRIPSHKGAFAESKPLMLLPCMNDSPINTSDSQMNTTSELTIKPRLFTGVVSFKYVSGLIRSNTRVMKTGTTQIASFSAFE